MASSSSKFIRILVHIKRSNTSTITPAAFDTCLFEQLGFNMKDKEVLEESVQCHLENNKLILELSELKQSHGNFSKENNHIGLLRVSYSSISYL